MCDSCRVRIDDVWLHLQQKQTFQTPDHLVGVMFSIDLVGPGAISIVPQNVQITRLSFIDTLHYLRKNHHHTLNPCQIGSNNNSDSAGPLCNAARDNNGGVRCINYILPILQNSGLVGIGCNQPNTTWLISRWSE